jgi:hypothetical protein
MILMKDDLDRECQWLFLRCMNTAAAKAEILTLFSDEPDDEHEWSEKDLYEQMRKIIQKYS